MLLTHAQHASSRLLPIYRSGYRAKLTYIPYDEEAEEAATTASAQASAQSTGSAVSDVPAVESDPTYGGPKLELTPHLSESGMNLSLIHI